MAKTTRSPFEGQPATTQVTDVNGNPAFRVEPRFLTPLRASMVRFLSGVSAVGLFLYGLGSLASVQNPDGDAIMAAMMIPVVGGFALHAAFKSLLRKRVEILMTLDRFSVRGLFGWKHYDRLLPHRFAILPHDWQQLEREQDEYRMQEAQYRKQAPVKKSKLYANSFHISFDYLGQRNDLMTVFGQKEAVAIAMRLKACDDVLDALVRRGQGTPLSPQDEWGDQPGEIPAEYV